MQLIQKNGNEAFINNSPLNYLFSAFNQSFPSIKLKFVSTKEIEDITNSLKSKDSHGYDEIQTKMLKASIPYISSPLTCLCNWLLPSGIFHSRLKFSEIKTLFKKGDKSYISNYRPISILKKKKFSKILRRLYLLDLFNTQTIIRS